MSAKLPDASVVISVKNRSRMLWDCFEGLAAQTLGRGSFEVLLIDNCSTEDLGPVIQRARAELGLAIRSARTAVDKGPAPARNVGASMALAPILALTDSDCRPHPEWLARGIALFRDEAVAMASGSVLPKPGQPITPTSKITFVTRAEHPTFPAANLFIRRSVFEALGGFDAALSFRDPLDRATECADTDLAWRLIKAGHQRRFDPDAIVYHEVEDLSVKMWLLEGTRLFVLPELVRRHPELRRELLTARVLFYPPAILIYVGLVLLLAGALFEPWLLAAIPVLLVARGVQRTGTLDPRKLAVFCGRVLLHLPRMMVMSAALLYGSIRFRSLVL